MLRTLMEADYALSHTQVLERLSTTDCDPTTIYRNLIKLRDAKVAVVVSRAQGIDRYALAPADGDTQRHPHFVCEDCGSVSCLPDEISDLLSIDGPWGRSVASARVQLHGTCPDCLENGNEAKEQ